MKPGQAGSVRDLGGRGKYGDLKRRLLFLLGALVVLRIGAHMRIRAHLLKTSVR